MGAIRGMSPVGARGRDCAGPGFLLTGDAAGFFDPFTGEGIYRALVGGEIASMAALRVLAKGDSPGIQRDYVQAREDAFRDKERLTRLVQLFVQVPSLLEYALPRLAARPGAGQVLSSSLGDLVAPGAFLRPGPLWEALRP
jgi:flavin-dependent dehydrogenase